MDTKSISDKLELTELVNKLFMYTDSHAWNKLQEEVFNEMVWFDMSSAGGSAPSNISAQTICEMWEKGFSDIDSVHHQAGHYLVNVNNDLADIYAYCVATHYKNSATNGNTRTFTGSYEIEAIRTSNGWRLSSFKYILKFLDGNIQLD
jgi:hypothetical protein